MMRLKHFSSVLCSRKNTCCFTLSTLTSCNSTSTSFLSKKHLTTSSNGNSNGRPGLFSLPNLHQPSDFPLLASNAISNCNNLREQLRNSLSNSNNNSNASNSNSDSNNPHETLILLDDISNTVCSVIDASELCRSVHINPQWRNSASHAFQILSEYIAELNADPTLYQSLTQITSNPQLMNDDTLNQEEKRMAMLLQKEFERDGIHLEEEKRLEVQKLSGFVTQLETLFTENLIHNKVYDLTGGDLVKDVLDIIPKHILHQHHPQPLSHTHTQNDQQIVQVSHAQNNHTSVFDTHTPNSLTLTTDPHITSTLLRHSPSPALRKQIYYESNTTNPQNLDILDALISQRHALASAMGYPSYAHYFTFDKMTQSPNNVHSFLKSVNGACEHQYKKDMELLRDAKRYMEGDNDDGELHPWDLNYYNGLVKNHLLNNGSDEKSGDGNENYSLNGYFTVEQSIKGMNILVSRLFGIVMQEVTIPPEEQWDVIYNDHKDNTNEDRGEQLLQKSMIRKFEFIQEDDGQELGTMYLDLHPREGKYAHAAHFTVRCGCESRNTNTNTTSSGEQYQLPIVALVCNLSPPISTPTTSSSSTSRPTAVISHSEVETLYHEFGHALHSLLSRTKFQHLSGTRAAMDFVETPSHLMEYFVWDSEFLSLISQHYITGESLKPTSKRIQNLIRSRNVFRAIDVQTQVVYGMFDQTIFGDPDLWRNGTTTTTTTTTTDVFASLHRKYNVPYMDGTHWHSRFGHLVTYGAGYYSYLYASIFSADLWNTCFAAEGGTGGSGNGSVLSRKAGNAYWKEMLIHGGAKDPNLMLKAMLGREPKVDSFFQSLG